MTSALRLKYGAFALTQLPLSVWMTKKDARKAEMLCVLFVNRHVQQSNPLSVIALSDKTLTFFSSTSVATRPGCNKGKNYVVGRKMGNFPDGPLLPSPDAWCFPARISCYSRARSPRRPSGRRIRASSRATRRRRPTLPSSCRRSRRPRAEESKLRVRSVSLPCRSVC